MRITHCQMAHLTNPLGYDLGAPVVSWLIEAAEGEKMASARVCVAADAAMENALLVSSCLVRSSPAPVTGGRWRL